MEPQTIGVDLDGTLAESHGQPEIGEPIPRMMNRVRKWLNDGFKVVIFTARAEHPDEIPKVKAWLKNQNLPQLEITNVKDHTIAQIWDDRAIGVRTNTGEVKNMNETQIQETSQDDGSDTPDTEIAQENLVYLPEGVAKDAKPGSQVEVVLKGTIIEKNGMLYVQAVSLDGQSVQMQKKPSRDMNQIDSELSQKTMAFQNNMRTGQGMGAYDEEQ